MRSQRRGRHWGTGCILRSRQFFILKEEPNCSVLIRKTTSYIYKAALSCFSLWFCDFLFYSKVLLFISSFFVISRLFSLFTCVWLVNSLLFKYRLFLPCLPASHRYRSVFCSAFVSGIFALLVFFIWVVTVLPQANYDPYLCLLLAETAAKEEVRWHRAAECSGCNVIS